MTTVTFYRLYNVLEDRPCSAAEVKAAHQAMVDITATNRVMEGRPRATSEAADVNGYRWAAVYRIRGDKLPSQAAWMGWVAFAAAAFVVMRAARGLWLLTALLGLSE